ncbi:MAG: ATP-binding protein [Planctomycetota bacterium]
MPSAWHFSYKATALKWSRLPKRSGEYVFEIIMRRYETRSTIMTSNRPLEDWGKLIGDVPAATAILDRFLHHAEIITIPGKSYRLKNKTGKDPTRKPETQTDEACQENTPRGKNKKMSLAGFDSIIPGRFSSDR